MTLAARRRESTGSMNEVRCFGCGALVLDVDGPTHDYMLAAPGCWALYCSLEDWKSHLAMPGAVAVVQDLVDAYAAQHPAHADRRNRQSVAIHLMSLCLALERGGSVHCGDHHWADGRIASTHSYSHTPAAMRSPSGRLPTPAGTGIVSPSSSR